MRHLLRQRRELFGLLPASARPTRRHLSSSLSFPPRMNDTPKWHWPTQEALASQDVRTPPSAPSAPRSPPGASASRCARTPCSAFGDSCRRSPPTSLPSAHHSSGTASLPCRGGDLHLPRVLEQGRSIAAVARRPLCGGCPAAVPRPWTAQTHPPTTHPREISSRDGSDSCRFSLGADCFLDVPRRFFLGAGSFLDAGLFLDGGTPPLARSFRRVSLACSSRSFAGRPPVFRPPTASAACRCQQPICRQAAPVAIPAADSSSVRHATAVTTRRGWPLIRLRGHPQATAAAAPPGRASHAGSSAAPRRTGSPSAP